jgi:NADH:ubiquinone oxidoreductase subunit F (NADH-binding)
MSGPFSTADEAWLSAIETAPAEAKPRLLDAPVRLRLRSNAVTGDHAAHDVDEHLVTYGPRPDGRGQGGRDLLAELERVQLTGRGGGHFPAARKWHAAIGAGGGGLVVANCAEGEPASAKDRTLLRLRPHLVLDGLELAAETVGAPRAVVYLHRRDKDTRAVVRSAIAHRNSTGVSRIDVRIAEGPDHYLTGESSAVVRALSGGPALPYLARVPAAHHGVGGRPTLVHNVETLARVALVARAGRDGQPDGALVTVVGHDERWVVVAGHGESFTQLLHRVGVMGAEPPRAVLVGGYGGTWLPWARLAQTEVSLDGLAKLGASLGAGVIAPVDDRTCGLVEASAALSYLAGSSARQCGPCLFGLPALAEVFERLARSRCSRADLRRLERYAGEVSGRGACHHPDGAVRMALSALETFAVDVRRHLSGASCPTADRPARLPRPAVG